MKKQGRREFLKTVAAAGAGSMLTGFRGYSSQNNSFFGKELNSNPASILKVAIIGCGIRGTSAAINAGFAEKNIRIVALADVFADKITRSVEHLKENLGSRLVLDEKATFVGFDSYLKALDTKPDVVILATPPQFRPTHIEACVQAGTHMFIEKPVAVDIPGLVRARQALATAAQKKLSVVSGLCYRYDRAVREIMNQIHQGALGTIIALESRYHRQAWGYTSKQPHWSEMEHQLRNWPNFVWLSGDATLEILIHNLDLMSWALGGKYPVVATGLGGKEISTVGGIFDHHSMTYEYDDGKKLFASCRAMAGCGTEFTNIVYGSQGRASITDYEITGEKPWQYKGPAPDMYQNQMNELISSIRSTTPLNDGEFLVNSTAMGIMGRLACYTGLPVTWSMLWESQQNLSPEKLEFGAAPNEAVAVPGKTRFL